MYCNFKSRGGGFSLRGSPHYFQCKACQVLSFRTLNSIVNMHYVDHVRGCLGKADIRSRQESRPTMLNIVNKVNNTLFNRNTGFVVNNTSRVNLPEQKPIDVNDPVACLDAVSAIRHSGVPNYRGGLHSSPVLV